MLTVSDEDELLLEAIRSGADGYLLKNLTAEEFLRMLRGLERGEAALTPQTTARLLKRLGRLESEKPQYEGDLSQRELEVLQLVAEGLSNRAIAAQLGLSENTVKYHLKNILQKLHAHNRAEAVARSMQLGLLAPPTEQGHPNG
jgi:two-component system NarL family response regulator